MAEHSTEFGGVDRKKEDELARRIMDLRWWEAGSSSNVKERAGQVVEEFMTAEAAGYRKMNAVNRQETSLRAPTTPRVKVPPTGDLRLEEMTDAERAGAKRKRCGGSEAV